MSYNQNKINQNLKRMNELKEDIIEMHWKEDSIHVLNKLVRLLCKENADLQSRVHILERKTF